MPGRAVFIALLIAILPPAIDTAADARKRRVRVPGPIPAEVRRIVDGDTLVVVAQIWIDQRLTTRVRIAGIDTPELRGRCPRERRLARQARDRVRRLAATGRIILRDIRYGKYAGRVVARVFTEDGREIGPLLRRAGLARPYAPRRRYRSRRRNGWWPMAPRRRYRGSAWCRRSHR